MKLKKMLGFGILANIIMATIFSLYSYGNNKVVATVSTVEINYKNVEDLATKAPLVIKGKVVDIKEVEKVVYDNAKGEDEDFDEIIYTNKVFKVEKVYKGSDVKSGDEILVRILEGEIDDVVQHSEFTVSEGESYVLFLKPSVYPKKDGAYAIEGGAQGIFEIKNKSNKNNISSQEIKVVNEKYKEIESLDELESTLENSLNN
ncbi:hypothetical protein T458_09740 [Brevibacillus panacihumi W25]|uniref:Uncharacterized protein n=1 Tax=Brevibacillus panacihumi W25 TaxID=1408254 RepID=V6M934_9BACL|nr:hypothetical protein [Brevibacillus panacihumi]EST55066.1 hypothetical protein T458_09740 [Brevibacillus panacihumi W25]